MFVGSVRAWVRGFHRLSLWVRHLECWFVSSLLERWFNVLIFCFQCFADCGCCGFFFRCRGLYFRWRKGRRRLKCFAHCGCCGFFFFFSDVMDFFSQREKRKKETEVSWVSIVKIEHLILEFHVNFNRNQVCDTRFARVNSSSSAERC